VGSNIPPERIGQYKIRGKLGKGGYGVVYLAEQKDPIREVALKVIGRGGNDAQEIAWFEVERQALACMEHPYIAKVLDSGFTDKGQPFLVMELVRGSPITEFCDERQIGIPERVKLFQKVCEAVQHAHQKPIIHRDIKPSNVLVALEADEPVPKVIDFGIAKALGGQRLTDKTLGRTFEIGGRARGTVAYMSPEQARPGPEGLDVRSDVYSLGVLLYELLTGTTPIEFKRVREESTDEIRRIIREEEVPAPSKRLSMLTGTDLSDLASGCSTSVDELIRRVRGDLDRIVMTCLQKDRTRRYDDVKELREQIENYLTNRPVEPPPARYYAYVFKKFFLRHRLAVGAGGAVVVSLLLGIVGLTWALGKAKKAEAAANSAKESERLGRVRADSLRRSSDSVLNFANLVLFSPDTYNVRDGNLNFDFLLREAESRLPLLADDRARANVLCALGRVAANWGRYDQGKVWLADSVKYWRQLAQDADTESSRRLVGLELAMALNYLAWAIVGNQDDPIGITNRARMAEPYAKEAFHLQESVTEPNADTALCWRAEWLRIRQLADAPDVLDGYVDLFATVAGQTKAQFNSNFVATARSAVSLAKAGNRNDAHGRIREFIKPFLDPARPGLLVRVPVGLARVGDQVRRLPASRARLIGVDQDLFGTMIIEVATELGSEILPKGHGDLDLLNRLTRKVEKEGP